MPTKRAPTWTDRALFARSVRRLLLKRLSGLTLAVCVLTAIGFYQMERARFAATLRDGVLYASERFERLAAAELDAPDLGDHARLQAILDNFQLFSQPLHLGVSARLSLMNARGEVAATSRNPDFSSPEPDAWLATHGYAPPVDAPPVDAPPANALPVDAPRYELAFIGARPYLHMIC